MVGVGASGVGDVDAPGQLESTAYATVQDDGNIVVYEQASLTPLWASGTYARHQTIASGTTLKPGWWAQGTYTRLVMQTDGNLVMYRRRDGAAIWSSRTYGHPGAYAVMQSDGNFVVYKSTGGPGRAAPCGPPARTATPAPTW
ncbi:hypothetical protein ACWEO4_43280 [Streptomyces sp. NPDC004393]